LSLDRLQLNLYMIGKDHMDWELVPVRN